jgi:hypothetical protein
MRRSRLVLGMAIAGGLGLLLACSVLFVNRPAFSVAAPLAQIVDEGEPNNDFDAATELSMPATVNGVAYNQPITETDFFHLPTTSGRVYRASLSIGGAGDLRLKLVVYDDSRSYLTSSSSSNSAAELTWSAYGPSYFIEVQPSGPTTTTLLTADYVLDVFRIAATPTATGKPTQTPTSTPTPVGPTPIPGTDRFEPNYDFDHAATLATDVTYDLNFIPWAGAREDNDFFKIWVKPGLFFSCETMDLAPGVDTNMIFYDKDFNTIAGNDDVTLGDYRSRLSYYSGYEGFLYVLVGHGGRFPLQDVQQSQYKLRCSASVPGQATATPVPARTATPAAPSSPLPTPTPDEETGELTVRVLTTPTPPPSGTPAPRFVPVDLLIYYDGNDDRSPGAGEGVAGVVVLAYDTASNEQIAQGLTDETGRLEFTASARGAVRLSIPYLGVSQLVGGEGASVYVRIAPQPLPDAIP